jgi:hypothetical protein
MSRRGGQKWERGETRMAKEWRKRRKGAGMVQGKEWVTEREEGGEQWEKIGAGKLKGMAEGTGVGCIYHLFMTWC